MVHGQVFLKGGLEVQFSQGLSFLHLEIILLFANLHHAFKEKLFFLPL